MVFSSITFLCAVLPVTFIVYGVLPSLRVRNALLILVSLLFYSYGEPVLVLLMLASTFANYLFGLWVGSAAGSSKKAGMVVAACVNLGLLGVFKYANMAVSTLNALVGTSLPLPNIALPLGISFYTFQALSYVIDVYRGDVAPQRSYARILLYISFFPQLIAGPIVKYHDIEQQMANRHADATDVALGLRRFCVGLSKKVLIANTMAATADALFAGQEVLCCAPAAWLAAFAYLMQIYFDFSGYSDMAIGLGRMFGFHFKENFDHPYGSVSVKEFWRRWHMSLSTWLKEYVYIPLGGNRRGHARAAINRIIVFFLCGLWHGASWTFVVWGLLHGAFLLLEAALPVQRLPRVLGHVYTVLFVMVAFVVFRCESLAQSAGVISAMFVGWGYEASALVPVIQQLTPLFLATALVAVLACAPVPALIKKMAGTQRAQAARHLREAPAGSAGSWVDTLSYVASVALLVLCVASLSSGTYNPFIYFRF